MAARFWMLVFACTIAVGASGCGSCRWHHRRCGIPCACVPPFCDDPACVVCSPVPPLYDGWGMQVCAGFGCGCGGMPCGPVMGGCAMPCGDAGSCGMPMSMDGCVIDGGCTVCPHCHQPASTPTYAPGAEPMTSYPAEMLFNSSPATLPQGGQPVPMAPPSEPANELAPEPPLATPTSLLHPSEYFAPNKRAGGPAPLSSTGPVQLAPPPAFETPHDLEQTSLLRLPPLP